MFELRPYQKELLDNITENKSKRKFIQAATGFGKTCLFSEIANNHKGKVLILVNRVELLEQTVEAITRSISLITAKTKTVGKGSVLIGMVESVNNRIKKNLFNLEEIDLVIIDEAHNLQFTKIIENYEGEVIAVSATPVTMKKESYYKCKYCETKYYKETTCCNKDAQKYTLNVSLKRWYGDLIQGVKIQSLIQQGFLTPVHNLSCDNANLDKLKTDSSGEYTNKSQNEVFNNLASTENLLANYKEHCIGKKTMVFNSNIEANNEAIKMFEMQGYKVRGFDSKTKGSRKETVQWFKDTPDGILMSVGVFTTGFSVDDVEAIIMNKATQSLSLYHQIVGRGGRITNKIYKPFFLFIDLGGNLGRFGSWSDDVDWDKIYNNEKEKKTRIRELEDFIICHNCDSLIESYDCEVCGAKEPTKRKMKSKIVIAKEIKELPLPNPNNILRYAISKDLDINGAKNLTANYIMDILIFAKTKKEVVYSDLTRLEKRIDNLIRPIYFTLHGSELKGNRKRTLLDFRNKVLKNIDSYYNN